MALNNMLFLTQIVGYFVGIILSLCILVLMSLHQAEFEGHCLLFSGGTWNDITKNMVVEWATPVHCRYVLFVGVVMMIACCVQFYRLLMMWIDGRDTSFLSSFLEATGCLVLCGLVISAAISITLGFMTWCQSVTKTFNSCEDVADESIDNMDPFSTEWFYVEIWIAELCTWAAFATLVGLVVGSTLQLLHHHEMLNAHAVMRAGRDDERQPLLNSGWPQDGCSADLPTEA